ncbi:CBASS cGAMP synthase [Paraburkholderia nemoris]|uniref:CBASS cGAMP synthase n=1 Tax=Paraburkholderia nemoris TaxID=2793076 RepID=UPI0038B9B2D1
MLKLHRLLHAPSEPTAFYSEIQPTEDQRTFLRDCRNKVRDYLRPRIAEATTALLGMPRPVTPRFRTQGSWNYDTCAQPCHRPPQEMDWDYGVYLPVEVWQENGPPVYMARAYFELVEHLLDKLCAIEGWTLNRDKPTCSRIHVAPWAHMDIPLYAASAEEFKKVVEAERLAKSFGQISTEAAVMDGVEQDEVRLQSWDELEDIVLATRDGLWKPSDPNDVALWFNDRLEEAGVHRRQLRRVCRYLKAWRDFHWKEGGPTSVSIMIAVARNFNGLAGRDDIVLQRTATELTLALAGDIYEPGIDGGEEDFNRLNPVERKDASALASRLTSAINTARNLNIARRADAVTTLRAHLGLRIPNRPDWVEIDSSGDDIRSVPAQKVDAPAVPATKAG